MISIAAAAVVAAVIIYYSWSTANVQFSASHSVSFSHIFCDNDASGDNRQTMLTAMLFGPDIDKVALV